MSQRNKNGYIIRIKEQILNDKKSQHLEATELKNCILIQHGADPSHCNKNVYGVNEFLMTKEAQNNY